MPNFKYKIKNSSGEVIEATSASQDRYTLAKELKKNAVTVISIEEMDSSYFSMEAINILLAKVKPTDKIHFTKNLAVMIKAGLPLSRSLGILSRQTKNVKFKSVISSLEKDLNKGTSLSDSMSKFPKVFSALFVSMIRAGEESGSMSESLATIGHQIEKSYLLKKKIKGAMLYPSIVVGAMIIISILMLMFVVPTLTDTFKELDMELPKSTKFVIALSDFLAANAILSVGIIIAFISVIVYGVRTKMGKKIFEFSLLRLPVIGRIAKQSNTAQTTRTLSSLLSAGVGLVDALAITGDILQNSYYKKVIKAAGENVQKGGQLFSVFNERQDLYPILVGEMIEVGEETGKLSSMLINVAEFYESEVDMATKNISTIIEPILMVFMGASVGFFAVSMISPIYSLSSAI